MTWLFMVCAVLGGTVLLCQFLMTVMGFMDFDGDVDTALDADVDDLFSGADDAPHPHDHHVDSNWIFAVIPFKTVIAAMTFFGLAGLASLSAQLSGGMSLGIAALAGISAMYLVHWMMQAMQNLREDGTVRIDQAIGQEGTVYLRIPAQKGGAGKVTVRVAGRSMEYIAMTDEEGLPTGAKVLVVGVIGPDTLQVEAIRESEASPVA